jgi:hypothetical protein
METICQSETSGCLRSTRHYNPEDRTFHHSAFVPIALHLWVYLHRPSPWCAATMTWSGMSNLLVEILPCRRFFVQIPGRLRQYICAGQRYESWKIKLHNTTPSSFISSSTLLSFHLGQILPFVFNKYNFTYCHVFWVCVTNSNGFWIWWLDLLALLYNSNQLWQLTINNCLRLCPFLAGVRVSSLLRDWLCSNLRVGHFFSFRCPLVNTPQLNTELLNCLLNSLNEWISWIHEWTLFCNFGRTE